MCKWKFAILPQAEKESGAEREEDIAPQEPFYKLNNDNGQLHTTSYGLSNLCTTSFLLPCSLLHYCIVNILNLSNSYILPQFC